MYTSRKPAHLTLARRSDDKPLPHRPFSNAPALERGQANEEDIADQRRPSVASEASTIVLTPMKASFGAPASPPRLHLPPHRIGQLPPPSSYVSSNASKTFFYRTDSNVTSDTKTHFAGFPQTPHSLAFTSTKSSTAPLLSEKSHRRPPSFFRRHWFVIIISIATLLGIGLAIVAVMVKRNAKTKEQSMFIPTDLTSSATDDAATLVASTVTSLVVDLVSTTISDLAQVTSVPL